MIFLSQEQEEVVAAVAVAVVEAVASVEEVVEAVVSVEEIAEVEAAVEVAEASVAAAEEEVASVEDAEAVADIEIQTDDQRSLTSIFSSQGLNPLSD